MSGKVNQLKGGVVLSYVSMVVHYAVSIVYTPIMLRLLGQSEFGLYNLVSSFVSYLGLLSFGFDNTYVRYYTQYKHTKSKEKVASLNGMFLLVFCSIGLIAGICGGVLCQFTDVIFGTKLTAEELITAKRLMALLVVNIAIAFPANLFRSYINANEKFVFSKLVNLIKTVANPFVVLPLLLMGFKSYALVLATLLYSIVIDCLYIFYSFTKLELRFSFKGMEWSVFRGIATFSLFIFLGEIVDEINWQLDKFLLGRFCGTVAVAVYGVASTLSFYFRNFSSCISGVFAPRVNKIVALGNDEGPLSRLMIKIGRIQFLVLALVATGFVFFGKEFCVLWAGPDYEGSYLIAVALILPSIIPLIQNVGIAVLTAKNKHKFRSVAYFFIAILNLAVSIPLCMRFEGLGCAIGTAFSMIFGNGLLINLYYKKLGIDIIGFWKSILSMCKGLLLPIAIGVASLFVTFPYSWLDLVVRIIVFTATYAVSMYCLAMNDSEKDMVLGFVKKFKKAEE